MKHIESVFTIRGSLNNHKTEKYIVINIEIAQKLIYYQRLLKRSIFLDTILTEANENLFFDSGCVFAVLRRNPKASSTVQTVLI